MTDLEYTKSKQFPWVSLKDSSVVGAPLLQMADWITQFEHANGQVWSLDEGTPRLLLPSIQRGAVWRARQVLDFWDSLLRGFPIGAFYVMRCNEDREVRQLPSHEGNGDAGAIDVRTISRTCDYTLLDGQQRIRALLGGLAKGNDEKRCVWIDLSKFSEKRSSQVGAPFLYLTSQAQPFGYNKETGTKLSVPDRRKALQQFSKHAEHPNALYTTRDGVRTKAYPKDLFEGPITFDDGVHAPFDLEAPPKPYGSCVDHTIPMWRLFRAWSWDRDHFLDGLERDFDLGLKINPDLKTQIIATVTEMFCRLTKAEVALIKAECDARNEQQDIATLFTRIGTGGTALTAEERLYSIYKHYEPAAHRLVETIRCETGNILPAVKIAGVAIRIANVRWQINKKGRERGDKNIQIGTLAEERFIKEITKGSSFKQELTHLMPPSVSDGCGLLASAFLFLGQAVCGVVDVGTEKHRNFQKTPFWIPDVLLAALPAPLWELLAFWAVQAANPDPCGSRREIVRFILFWLLCVKDDVKACDLLFKHLVESTEATDQGAGPISFPGKQLYLYLIAADEHEVLTRELVPADVLRKILVHKDECHVWRSHKERFETFAMGQDAGLRKAKQLAAHWWGRHGGAERLLPWLQRDYIVEAFGDYLPLGNHEDDLPYDVDHICPTASWGWSWGKTLAGTRFQETTKEERDLLYEYRDLLGNSIGNLQLLNSSENRQAQDDDWTRKSPTHPSSMDPNIWKRVSETAESKAKIWSRDRRMAFQSAVEHRAARLYEQFFCQLEFDEWADAVHPPQLPEPA